MTTYMPNNHKKSMFSFFCGISTSSVYSVGGGGGHGSVTTMVQPRREKRHIKGTVQDFSSWVLYKIEVHKYKFQYFFAKTLPAFHSVKLVLSVNFQS